MRKLVLALAMMSAATPAFSATIYNGDFTLGNVGFSSAYNYVTGTGPMALWPESSYAVGTSAQNYHMYWADYADHTGNAVGPRNYMIVNGNTRPDETVWQLDLAHAVSLSAGTYRFSFALSDACCTNAVYGGQDPAPPSLWVNLNGQTSVFTMNPLALPTGTAAGQWRNVYADFTVTSAQAPLLATFGIVNQQTAYGGNDFGIDDIALTAVPEPISWAMMVGGFGLMGATMRRRRTNLTFA